MTETSQFDDIRPYNDDEVRPVLDELIADREFVQAIALLRHPRLTRFLGPLVRHGVRSVLRKATAGMNSVTDFQLQVREYLDHSLEQSADSVTCSGIEKLSTDKAYLFISNHRDISMDPALCNLMLFRNGMQTVRIAIGDNLLTKPYASKIMRLNKSFIVRRSITGRREKLEAFKTLSAYILHSIKNDNQSIWIAQREGRAKDGVDSTDSAILKMFLLSKEPTQSMEEAVRALHIVPVSISYQWDPCDQDKARELTLKETEGGYQKGEHEDVLSIAKGITGYKGKIHVAFGNELNGNYTSVDALVEEIDRQIISMYQIQDSNVCAYARLNEEPLDDSVREANAKLQSRLDEIPEEYHRKLLESYANPVVSRQHLVEPPEFGAE